MAKTRKFTLTGEERLNMQSLLPENANIITLRLMEEITKAIRFTEPEMEAVMDEERGIGSVSFRKLDNLPERECEFSGYATKLIEDQLRKHDREGTLIMPHLGIWEKFLGSEGMPEPEEEGPKEGLDSDLVEE